RASPCPRSDALRPRRSRTSRLRKLPRVRKQVGGDVFGDRVVVPPEIDALEPPLVQPLPAAATGRRGDSDRLELARTQAGARGRRDRRPLRAHAERISRVLDVHAVEHAPVLRQHARTDEIARVRSVRPWGERLGPRDELLTRHESNWKTTSVTSA